jgi:hypothetical protein
MDSSSDDEEDDVLQIDNEIPVINITQIFGTE